MKLVAKYTLDIYVSVLECKYCKEITPTKDAVTVSEDLVVFGAKGYTNIKICKKCHREQNLNTLLK